MVSRLSTVCGNICSPREEVSHRLAMHGLHRSVISELFEAGHGGAAAALRSGHRDESFFCGLSKHTWPTRSNTTV